MNRRTFLRTAAIGAAAAPALVKVLGVKDTPQIDLTVTTYQLDSKVRYAPGVIKVPSNRWNRCVGDVHIEGQPVATVVEYVGDWDGTFKRERGCTNPAWILADLYEWTRAEPDRMLAAKVPFSASASMVMDGLSQLLKPQLDWQMLYHWGQWCDEIAEDWTCMSDAPGGHHTEHSSGVSDRTRFTCSAVCYTSAEVVQLRETLRMYCLSWQAGDPRYRTSYPWWLDDGTTTLLS